MKKAFRFLGLAAAGLAIALTSGKIVLADLNYEGSVPIGEYIMPEASKAFLAKTKIKFQTISSKGTDEAYKSLMNGKATIGGIARNLNTEEKGARLVSEVIGFDTMAVFVNENNKVGNLSKEQLKGIFTGTIKNWKEVGGANAPIVAVMDGTPGRTVGKEFKKAALDGADIVATSIIKNHLQTVASDVNAVTFDSLPFQIGKTKSVAINNIAPTDKNVRMGTYPLSRPLNLVCKEKKGEVEKFMDFMLSTDGQEIVRKSGFVSVD